MAGTKRRSKEAEYEQWEISVHACSMGTNKMAPGLMRSRPEEPFSSRVTIEGELDKPVGTGQQAGTRIAVIVVFCEDNATPGAAIGIGGGMWQLVVSLPEPAFGHLASIMLAERLAAVTFTTERVLRGKAQIVYASFKTADVPSDQDEDPQAE